MIEEYFAVCDVADVRDGEPRLVDAATTGSVPVALFCHGGTVYAIDDTCTHAEASLADGWQEGCVIECPLHLGKFDVRTGAVLSLPPTRPLRCWRVRIDGSTVSIAPPAGNPTI